MEEKRRPSTPMVIARGMAGAIAGAVAGYSLFDWLLTEHGYYAQAMPGALTGLVCGWVSGRKSWALAVLCMLLAAAIGLACEYGVRAGDAETSLASFVAGIGDLPGSAQLRLAVGVVLAGWLGLGRDRPSAK